MITYLKIQNLAIVEQISIEPGTGLNVLTGETGAGKSLLIDSLEFLSGARGSTESIRTGAEKMSAEGVFHLPRSLEESLGELGVDVPAEGGDVELVVRREISQGGRSRALLNGSVVTQRQLQSALDPVVEIHGQAQTHERVAGRGFREIVDEFSGAEALLETTRKSYREWKRVADELSGLQGAQRDRSLRMDLLKYQINELEAAQLQPGEEVSLRAEKAVLASAHEIAAAATAGWNVLQDDDNSALTQISRALSLLQPISRKIAGVEKLHTELEETRYRLDEISSELYRMSSSVRHDPERLEEVESRLALIERLKKKYGESVEAILAQLESVREEYERLADYEGNLERLGQIEAQTFESYRSLALDLSHKRQATAAELQHSIQSELADLAMAGTTVRIEAGLTPETGSRLEHHGQRVAFGPEGFDRIDFLIAPNRGEELRPMHKVASGGELSRIQLAIASALFRKSSHRGTATLVFDEIDAGIGGHVAEVVGLKLRQLAAANQVICVTHLPQIASMGTTHFRVWKDDSGGHTRAYIERLDDPERRVEEIARMLGGESVSHSARAHAIELLQTGSNAPAVSRKRTRSGAVS